MLSTTYLIIAFVMTFLAGIAIGFAIGITKGMTLGARFQTGRPVSPIPWILCAVYTYEIPNGTDLYGTKLYK